jgi:class 3 adenylate cyclase/tetratricopeptide (TPR) repeat protein
MAAASSPERRQLTLLFCDIVNYSGIASLLDPEDLHDLIGVYRQQCEERCAAHGGRAQDYGGDGILFVFGHPEAHENDAERAVRAGLELIDAVPRLSGPWTANLPFPLAIRVGVATGLCVVDASAVFGESVNLAARLQAAAAANTLVVGDATYRLIGGLFDCERLDALALKGFPRPTTAWRVTAAHAVATRFEGVRGSTHAPFVGRQAELQRLLELWGAAGAGRGRLVRLRGEPGMGKSRLIHEFRRRVGGQPAATFLYQCLPHHQHTALFPIVAQLERTLGVEDDEASVGLEQIEAMLVGSPEDKRDQLPLFAALLSVPADRHAQGPMSPLERKRRTLDALCSQVTRSAMRQPVLVIVEDAQWLDPTSIEFLDLLAARIGDAAVLIVIAERPRQEKTEEPDTIDLVALSAEEGREMASVLAGDRDISPVLDRILERTDGVPLFIEELTHSVLGSDVDAGVQPDHATAGLPVEDAIPMTLQDLLVARLDQLGPAKAVAQLASVIGREFTADLLSSIADDAGESLDPALDRLTTSGLVLRQRGGFLFRHALIQDAAYQSLLRSRRRELHARIAAVLERDSARQGAGQLELLAHHYELARLDRRALECWLRAGQSALERSANVEAREHFGRALAARARVSGEDLDQLELDCLIGLGAARRAVEGFASRGVEESFSRARALAERGVGSTAQLMDALRGLFACYYTRSDFRRAKEQAECVLDGARRSASYLMMGNWMLGSVLFWQGEFDAARHRLEAALSLYDPARQRSQTLDAQIDLQANATLHLGWTLWFLGHADQARARADEAIALSRRLGQPFALAMALFWACATRVCCGDRAAVESLTAELRDVTTKYHIAYLRTACTALEAHLAVTRGDFASGLDNVRRALEEFRRQSAGLGWTFAMSLPAAACAQLGQTEDGLALIHEAFGVAERHGDHFWEAELHRIKGDLVFAGTGDAAAADACYRSAAALARRQGARSLELRALTSLVRLARRQGQEENAVRLQLQSLCDSFLEGDDTDDLRNARRELEIGAAGSRQTHGGDR